MQNNKTCTCLSSALITTCKLQPSLTEWERFQRYEVPVGFTVQAAGKRTKMHLRAPPNSSVYETQENAPQPSLWARSTEPSCCLLSARHPHLSSQCFIGNICSGLGESSWSCALASAASPSAVPKSRAAPLCPQGGWGHFLEPPVLPHTAGALFLTQSSRNMPWYLQGALSDTIGVLNGWTHSVELNYLWIWPPTQWSWEEGWPLQGSSSDPAHHLRGLKWPLVCPSLHWMQQKHQKTYSSHQKSTFHHSTKCHQYPQQLNWI